MNHDIVLEFYFLALRDIENGASIDELEDAIKLYEEEENYEACAGILKAIHEAKYSTIKNIKNES